MSDDKFVLVSTNKPIMFVSKANEPFTIQYMTIDKSYTTPKRKQFLLKEIVSGKSDIHSLKLLLQNQLSIYDFMSKLSDKTRTVLINNKEFKSESVKDFHHQKEYLPDNSIYLQDMPNEHVDDPNQLLTLIQ